MSTIGKIQSVILVDSNNNPVSITGGGSNTSSSVEVTNFPETQQVSVSNFPATQPVSGTVTATGPVTNAQFTAVTGTSATAAYTDTTGAAAGTTIALLKGLYVQNAQIISLLTAIQENTLATANNTATST